MSFSYDGQLTPLFQNVNLNISSDWKLGLIGRNGKGKTTFLNLLQQRILPTSGVIQTGKINFNRFPIEVKSPELPAIMAIQEVYEIENWELEKELSQINENDADLIWRPYNQLSNGEQTQIQLAALFKDETAFPLLDEPTNHLDIKTRKLVAEYLKQKKQGFIVISHDTDFLNQIVDHILSIERTQILQYRGNYDVYRHEKGLKDQQYLNENNKLKNEINRLQQTANAKKTWAVKREQDNHGNPHVKGSGGTGHNGFTSARAKRTMKRSKAIEERISNKIEQKRSLMNDTIETTALDINYHPLRTDHILQTEKLNVLIDEQPLFKEPLSFDLKNGNQIILAGRNGAGKSTLLKALLNKLSSNIEVTGTFVFPKNIKISYVAQEVQFNGTLKELAQKFKLNFEELLNQLRKLGMERETFNVPIDKMSNGQQKKVALAKSLVEPANLYLWDEPLNFLDIENQDQIIELIKKENPTMLIIEHDKHFIDQFENVIRVN